MQGARAGTGAPGVTKQPRDGGMVSVWLVVAGAVGTRAGQCVRWFKWHQAVRVEDAIDLVNKTHGKRRIVGHARASKIGARGLGDWVRWWFVSTVLLPTIRRRN